MVDLSGHCIDTEAFKIPLPIKEAFGKTLNPFLIALDFFHLFFYRKENIHSISLMSPFKDMGGFQLLDLVIPELKSHVIPYKFKCSHWWKIHL